MTKIDDFALVEFIGDVHSAEQAGAPGITVTLRQAKAAVMAAEAARDAWLERETGGVAETRFMVREIRDGASDGSDYDFVLSEGQAAKMLDRREDAIRKEERAAIVEWLNIMSGVSDNPGDLADRIERGEHLA